MRIARRTPARYARVRTLMKPVLVTLVAEDLIVDAAERMRAAGASAALVVADGRLAGVLTERDLVRALATDPARLARVADHMTGEPCTVGPDDEAADVAALMTARGVRHLPVVDGDAVVGIVSARDLLQVSRRRTAEPTPGSEPW